MEKTDLKNQHLYEILLTILAKEFLKPFGQEQTVWPPRKLNFFYIFELLWNGILSDRNKQYDFNKIPLFFYIFEPSVEWNTYSEFSVPTYPPMLSLGCEDCLLGILNWFQLLIHWVQGCKCLQWRYHREMCIPSRHFVSEKMII